MSTKPSANPGKRKKEEAPRSRAEAIQASWQDKSVAAARAVKNKVKVGGTEYNSVADAFRQLRLPMSQHIKFRMELKASASGRKTFENEKGEKFSFTLVK
jgi:hypothetical protein